MIGNIAPVTTGHTSIENDQHQMPGVPGAGVGKKGDRYYVVFIGNKGTHVDFNNFDDDATDRGYRGTGNFYETEAAAQAIADKINAIFGGKA